MTTQEEEDVKNQALEWVKIDPCEETKQATQKMLDENDVEGLKTAFGSRVEFGTAGLRAEMGTGTSRMNDLIVIQTAQGLVRYLEKTLGEKEARERGIVLGFDHRARGAISSKKFALLTAAVCHSQNMKVYLFSKFVATPFVPFAVQHYNAAAGVMVTASHNPAADNGYKVYWGNACQIVPPHDSGIAASILENLTPWKDIPFENVSESLFKESDLYSDPITEIPDLYFDSISKKLCRFKNENASSELKICYTAMHGIGAPWTKRSFEAFGLNEFVPVKAQIEPDPTFPTAAKPNPEEKGALDFAMKDADEAGCTLILANDPDADRLAVAEKLKDGSWKVFSGNDTAVLFGFWEWKMYSEARKSKDGDASNVAKKPKESKGAAMVASTVSSKFLRAMGEKEGFLFEDCLTGFKWIGNKNLELREQGYDVIFTYEEAIGFCIGDNVVDKDGVSAAAVWAEMANQLYKEGTTCFDKLKELKDTYGHFVSNNNYIISHDSALNAKVFEALRTGNNGTYPESCCEGKYKIKFIRDLKSPGFDNSKPDNKPTLPVSASAQMITFTFENGAVCTLRMSGTEPKLKWYCELAGSDPQAAQKELDTLVEEAIKGDLLRQLI